MSPKTQNIINWVLTGLIAALFLFSASGKFMANEEAMKGAEMMGLSPSIMKMIGVVELIAIILFIIPRTGILGTLMLVAYLGGAIATHLEHGQSIIAPCIIAAFVWIVAVIRFPELRQRLFNSK